MSELALKEIAQSGFAPGELARLVIEPQEAKPHPPREPSIQLRGGGRHAAAAPASDPPEAVH
ncbi:hypothetical protein [Rhizobium lentis]|uniref:Uncharacterized protein n=1 Tax=Rhizobium lentis TaxID=1138194 RepID=A0A7W8UL73_9HYPH|nr:hypothetical protein [Rhizobium lentis]MBB4574002.1 hypothetical protein [Rhizobium lentis]MBB5549930.1 hypothetical protein [Rhizobium lentis]MBB5560062.1 hypothetical protein [Rhizobium lentis]MBB5567050.1 hypothetical protein [Rhizobium lentis]